MRTTRPFTVLDVTKWYGETSGGVRTYLDEKRRYVNATAGLRHVLVVPGDRDTVATDGSTTCYHLRGPRVPTQRQYRFLLAPRSLRLIIERERPDVIEVGSPLFVPWITRFASRRHRAPLVGFYHTNIAAAIRAVLGRVATRAAEWYIRRLDRLFETTFAASDAAEAELRAAGASRVTRIALGVDIDTFHPRRRTQQARTRDRLGLPLNGQLVVYLGRMAPEKDLHVALKAWPEVERRTDATLVMMGDGPLTASLRARSARNRVRWLPHAGDRDAVADVLSAADVYLAPGASETFGLAASEAMACGTPVVSVNRGGVSERVARTGAGLLFNHGDASSLAAQLVSALRGAPQAGRALARAAVEHDHAWQTVFGRIFSAYREVAGG